MDAMYDLATLPEGAVFHAGVAGLTALDGRTAIRVCLSQQMTRYEVPGAGRVDLPTFVSLPIWFEDGTIEVDVLSRTTHDASPSAEPLAGLAYRLGGNRDRFDAVEVRPLNGTASGSPTAQARRAAQFFGSPDWPFDRICPQGPGRDEVSDSWTRLMLEIDGTRLAALVDGVETFVIPVTRAATLRGDLGLFVDVGTEAFFSNLRMTPA